MILTGMNMVALLTSALMLVSAVGLIAIRHQRLFLALVMFLTALESTRDFAPNFVWTFSGVDLHPDDLIVIVCAVAALARIRQSRIRGNAFTAALVFAALVVLGVIASISTYGIQPGTNFWRPQLLIVALLMYTTTRSRAWWWTDLWVIVVVPAIMVAIASVVGILLHGFGSSSSEVVVNGIMMDDRPVLAPDSLLMLIGLWLTVFLVGKWSMKRVLVILLLGSMVLLTQIRSVWVSAILGVVVWWLAPRIHLRGAPGGLGGFSRTLVVFCVAGATGFAGASLAALGQSASDTGTFWWRVGRWAGSMNIPRSWLEWLVGDAFGPTPASTPTLYSTSAHSLLVNTIELTGFIGLGAILFLLIAVGRVRQIPARGPLGLVIFFTLLGFGVTYQLPAWAWMLVGILLATPFESTSEIGSLLHAEAHHLPAPDHLQIPVEGSTRLSHRIGKGVF